MAQTVFYSWQDDTPTRVNRQLIRDALQGAINELVAEAGVQDAVRLDQDTQGVPGNPVVVDVILAKIRNCRVFAPDLTFVAATEAGKKVPNPNVMLELGYALEALGDGRSLIVMNEYYGGPRELPFDLGNRRWPITYNLAPEATRADLQAAREQLRRDFVAALRAILAEPLPSMLPDTSWTQSPVHMDSSFLGDGDVLDRRRAGSSNEGREELITWQNDTQGFIRVLPARPKNLGRRELDELIRNYFPMGKGMMAYTTGRNARGACAYIAPVDEMRAVMVTQLFPTGESWGIHQPCLAAAGHLRMGTIQGLYRASLAMMTQAAGEMGLDSPLTIILGMSGIEGRALGVSPNVIAGACVDNQVLHQTQADTGPVDVNRIVADLLIKVCDSAGVDPPWELAQ